MTIARMAASGLLLLAAAGCVSGPAAPVPRKAQKGNPVMQIKFARSGGFAGAATNVSGTVELGGDGAQVKADSYQRELSPHEAQQLRVAADPDKLARARQAAASPTQARDAYQYDVTLVTKDGKTHTLTLPGTDPQALRSAAPEIADLAEWVEEETQKIWEHRVHSR